MDPSFFLNQILLLSADQVPSLRGVTGLKERTMPFVRLQDSDSKGSIEYFIRPELIRQVDITHDLEGKIIKLDVYLMDGNYQVREDSAYTFEREAAENAYSALRSVLNIA